MKRFLRILAATPSAAEYLGLQDDYGAVAPGKVADLLIPWRFARSPVAY